MPIHSLYIVLQSVQQSSQGDEMSRPSVSYLRVSGHGQVQGDGFPRQADKVSQYAGKNNLEIVGEFRDEGISGTSELADRPGLAALLDRIESNGVRIVLVENATRLARDLMVCEVILAEFRKLGVTVIECDGGNDLTVAGDDNPTGKLIRQILGAVAEFDKNVTVLKLRAARDRKRRTDGRCEGRKPFGHYPGESVIVEEMRRLRRKPKGRKCLSYAAIADRLNEAGHPTRQGGPWKAGSVQAVLKRVQS